MTKEKIKQVIKERGINLYCLANFLKIDYFYLAKYLNSDYNISNKKLYKFFKGKQWEKNLIKLKPFITDYLPEIPKEVLKKYPKIFVAFCYAELYNKPYVLSPYYEGKIKTMSNELKQEITEKIKEIQKKQYEKYRKEFLRKHKDKGFDLLKFLAHEKNIETITPDKKTIAIFNKICLIVKRNEINLLDFIQHILENLSKYEISKPIDLKEICYFYKIILEDYIKTKQTNIILDKEIKEIEEQLNNNEISDKKRQNLINKLKALRG